MGKCRSEEVGLSTDILLGDMIENLLNAFDVIGVAKVMSPKHLMHMPIHDFLTVVRAKTPQSYGSLLESKFVQELGLTKVSTKEDRGDCMDSMGDFYELKVSLLTETNRTLNIVQIRPWQLINGYFCITVDVRTRPPYSIQVFRLSRADMELECKILKATSAHGTRVANAMNENVELAIRVPIVPGDETYERWKSKYLSNYKF